MSYDALVVALREIVRFAEQSCRPGATTTNILQRERQIGDRLPFAGPFEKRLGGWRKSCSFTRGSVSGLALVVDRQGLDTDGERRLSVLVFLAGDSRCTRVCRPGRGTGSFEK